MILNKYTVKISHDALQDMEDIYNHIAFVLFSPDNARTQYDRIAAAILKLDQFPERFPRVDSKLTYLNKLRRMPVDSYSVFYLVDECTVYVTNILYSASDIENRLKDL